MKANTLTIGISTLKCNFEVFSHRLNKLIAVIEQCEEAGKIEVVVVIQDSDQDDYNDKNGVRYLFSTTHGLSKSRNIVITESRSEYIWFLDDDIEFTRSQIDYLLRSIAITSKDLILGKILCSDTNGYYKNYSNRSKSKFWMLKCSSIEIIAKRSFVKANDIKFNDLIGLGTKFPTGEENLFLLECRDCNASVLFLDKDIVSHPCLDITRLEFRKSTLTQRMYIQGYICTKMGFINGLLLFCYWCFKFSRSYFNLKVSYWMFKGLFLKF